MAEDTFESVAATCLQCGDLINLEADEDNPELEFEYAIVDEILIQPNCKVWIYFVNTDTKICDSTERFERVMGRNYFSK